jgi:uncharacterized surface protein with fasciclin (FAS1) repeats
MQLKPITAIIVLSLVVASLSVAGCTSSTNSNQTASSASNTATPPLPQTSIMEAASSDASLTTFVSLLGRANLTEALSEPGNYTVFAPTNAAFSHLNTSTLDALQSNPTALKGLLLYHIIPAALPISEFQGSGKITTVSGLLIPYSVEGATVRIGNATIGNAIETHNGILYKINGVLVPPSE